MKIHYKPTLLFIWMLAIFLLSNEVSDVSSDRSSAIVGVIESLRINWPQELLTFITRKAAHIFMYFVLGILVFNVVRDYWSSAKRVIVASTVFVMAYAITDELHQLFVPGRSGEIRDVLIDTAAGFVGVILFYCVSKRRLLRDRLSDSE